MKITWTPVLTSFLVLFLILWFFSFRINNLKTTFSKTERDVYLKKFKFIKNTTLCWVLVFLICFIVWLYLEYVVGYKLSFWSASLFFTTIGTLALTITSGIHYWIIRKVKKNK